MLPPKLRSYDFHTRFGGGGGNAELVHRDVRGAACRRVQLDSSLADPNETEGQVAMAVATQALPGQKLMYGMPGAPKNCQPGTMNGQEIRICDVCAVHLIVNTDNLGFDIRSLHLQRAEFNIPFRRAASFEQPTIAPADPAQGVWVSALSPGQAAPFREISGRDLTPDDLLRVGVTMARSGISNAPWAFSIRRPGYVGVIANPNVLLQMLAQSPVDQVMVPLVGSCDGTLTATSG